MFFSALLSIMSFAHHKKLTLGHSILNSVPNFVFLGFKPIFAPAIPPNNNFFQKFMRTYIEKVKN